ncbi:MAG: hypothetical protein HY754_02420 [Nitrospirae bacterium]|nr:hypothetical protein [Nitrospirota bacterium]
MNIKRMANVVLIAVSFLMLPVASISAEDVKINLKQDATIRDILLTQIGKRVVVRLDSSEEMEGTVVTVGEGLVHIAKLSGKDFYDAILRIDRISAVRMRVRDR